jgi:hypothetical protein
MVGLIVHGENDRDEVVHGLTQGGETHFADAFGGKAMTFQKERL